MLFEMNSTSRYMHPEGKSNASGRSNSSYIMQVRWGHGFVSARVRVCMHAGVCMSAHVGTCVCMCACAGACVPSRFH